MRIGTKAKMIPASHPAPALPVSILTSIAVPAPEMMKPERKIRLWTRIGPKPIQWSGAATIPGSSIVSCSASARRSG